MERTPSVVLANYGRATSVGHSLEAAAGTGAEGVDESEGPRGGFRSFTAGKVRRFNCRGRPSVSLRQRNRVPDPTLESFPGFANSLRLLNFLTVLLLVPDDALSVIAIQP
jgi:hypothetical protein